MGRFTATMYNTSVTMRSVTVCIVAIVARKYFVTMGSLRAILDIACCKFWSLQCAWATQEDFWLFYPL